MDLKDFLAIAGKPGLFKNIGTSKNGVIVETIPEGKKVTAFAHERISSLAEISIFTTGEDVPLADVFKKINDAYEGKEAIDPNSGAAELRAFMEKVLPDYDPERVYNSDIKKIVRWYNLLAGNQLLDSKPKAITVNQALPTNPKMKPKRPQSNIDVQTTYPSAAFQISARGCSSCRWQRFAKYFQASGSRTSGIAPNNIEQPKTTSRNFWPSLPEPCWRGSRFR